MGLHIDPGNATHVTRLLAAEAEWFRTWAWAEYQWMCSTPDSTSSRGTLTTSGYAAELHGVLDAHPQLKVMYPFLGVPRAVNPRCGTGAGSAGDGSYHRLAVSTAGRALFAADAATVASAFFTGYESRGVFVLWNEPQIDSFSKDLNYNGGAEASAAVFGAMVADAVAAIRAAVPGLPIGAELGAARGDMGSRGSGLSASYIGDTFAIAVLSWLFTNRPDAVPDLGMFHPYIYTTGLSASVDGNGVLSSSPYTSKGWNGILQMDAIQQYMVSAGCANRDALLGTGTGAARMSRKILGTEYGGPSREPAAPDEFTEGWQSAHDREYQEVIAFRQAVGTYHPVQIRYTSVDTASATASSAVADLHDYFGLFRQDGTHKPALDTWLLWARKPIDTGVPPDPPLVVPVDPPSPEVTGAFTGPPSIYSLQGSKLVPSDNTLQDRCWTRDEQHPRRTLCRGVLLLGGLGGWGPSCSPNALVAGQSYSAAEVWKAIVHTMTRRPGQPHGYTFLGIAGQTGVVPTGWGNDSSMAVIDEALGLFQAATGVLGGAKPGKVALIGTSMGHTTAFNYAVRNPDKVAGVIGFNPTCSLEYHWNGGVDTLFVPPGYGGVPSTIAQAFGLPAPVQGSTLDPTVKAQRDPLTRIHELAGMPWGISYGLSDLVVGRETVDAFIQAKGGPDAFVWIKQTDNSQIPGSHSRSFIGETDLLGVLDAFNWDD